jgi:hypothetical protein
MTLHENIELYKDAVRVSRKFCKIKNLQKVPKFTTFRKNILFGGCKTKYQS